MRQPLKPEQQDLAAQYLPLALSLAAPLRKAFPRYADDFTSAAQMGLVEAAQSFDPQRGLKFSTFCRFRISGALRDVQRGLIPPGWRDKPHDAPRVVSLSDLPDAGESLENLQLEESDAVEQWLQKLPLPHADVCRHIYVYGMTPREAADTICMTKARLTDLHDAALEHLRKPQTLGKPNSCGEPL